MSEDPPEESTEPDPNVPEQSDESTGSIGPESGSDHVGDRDTSDYPSEGEAKTGTEPGTEVDSSDDSEPSNVLSSSADGDPADGRDEDVLSAVLNRVAVGVVIVLVIVGLAAIAGSVGAPDPPTQTLDDAPDPNEEPEPYASDVLVDRIEAEGEVSVSENLTVDGGHPQQTVLVEDTGTFEQADVRQLVRATTMAGHEVQFGRSSDQDLEESLEDVDAYVLIAPLGGFSENESESIKQFTDRGGRLILLGSPDRVVLGPFGSLATAETDMRAVANQYGIVFGNRYLFDTTSNDGNYRQVFAEPTTRAKSETPRLDLDRVVLSTPTRVESSNATVLLRTRETTKLSDGGQSDAYPVAVANDEVLAIGDTEFLAEENHNVADNEELVTHAVEFALGG
jgi:hypothetical protein